MTINIIWGTLAIVAVSFLVWGIKDKIKKAQNNRINEEFLIKD